jgi:hypothetical protein
MHGRLFTNCNQQLVQSVAGSTAVQVLMECSVF